MTETATARAKALARRVARAGSVGWWAGASAALVLAVIEIAWPSTSLGGVTESVWALLAYLGLVSSLYVALGSVVGAALTSCCALLYLGTDASAWFGAVLERRRERRAADPIRFGLRRLGYAVAMTVAPLGWFGAVAIFVGYAQRSFHNEGLIAALDAAAAGALLVAAIVAGLIVARLIELATRLLGRTWAARWLGSRLAAALAVLAILGGAVAYAVVAYLEAIREIDLRPPLLGLVFAALLAGSIAVYARVGPLSARRPRLRWPARLAPPVAVVGLLGAAVGLGEITSSRHALGTSSSFGVYAVAAVRVLVDLDRDGRSPILGGGDCDDLDPDVHRGAFDWPDDGVDQNCMGGDATIASPDPPRFYPVPDTVPADLNVVLITVEAFRADHLGCYGYRRPTSPNLDELAREGIRFSGSYAACSTTHCAIPSILTGRLPLSVQYQAGNPARLRPITGENLTWPEILSRRGYSTAAVMGHRYFSASYGFLQGFAHTDNELQRYFNKGAGVTAERMGDRMAEQVEQKLRGRKFFLWAHFTDPHYPYANARGFSFGPREVDRYDGEIRSVDHGVGRFFDAMKRLGLWDKTIIVVTGDHGEGLGDGGETWHGGSLSQRQIHVPIIFRVPGLAPRVVEEPVSHVDLLPTVLNLVRAEPADSIQGRSAVGLMTGEDVRPRYVVSEIASLMGTFYAVMTRRWKLSYDEPLDSMTLYDLEHDPSERHDLAGQHPEIVRELLGPLVQRIERTLIDPEAARRLRRSVSRTRPRVATPIDAELGGAVRVLGVEIAPAKVRPGQEFRVTLFFESLKRLPGQHRLFVHLYWPGRSRFSNLDHDPVEGLYPFRYWAPGQYVRDELVTKVPPWARPGKMKLWIGIYEGKNRLPARGRAEIKNRDSIHVATVEVERADARP